MPQIVEADPAQASFFNGGQKVVMNQIRRVEHGSGLRAEHQLIGEARGQISTLRGGRDHRYRFIRPTLEADSAGSVQEALRRFLHIAGTTRL